MKPMPSTYSPSHRGRLAVLCAVLPLILILLLFFVLPMIGFMQEGFYYNGELSLANFSHLFNAPIYKIVIKNTFTIATCVTVLCIIVSYPLAYLMATIPARYTKILFFVILLPFWSSALVRTSAWIALLGKNGPLNVFLTTVGFTDQPITFLYNFTGVMIGMTHVLMPFVVLPLYASFKALDSTLIQAAQSMGAGSPDIFQYIIRPLTSPGMIAGAIIVFMNAVGYYITPSLMGGPAEKMIAELISYNISQELNWGLAAALALVLLLAVLLLLALFNHIFGLDKFVGNSDSKGNNQSTHQRTVGGRGAVIAGIACAIFLILPIMVVIPMSFSTTEFPMFPPPQYGLRWYINFFNDAKWVNALLSSITVGVVVTVITTLVGTSAALAIHKMRSGCKRYLDILFIIPMSVPTIITAISLYYLTAPLGWINNSVAIIIGHTVLASPYVYISIRAALQNFDPSLELAAYSLGASWPQMFRLVMLPVLLPSLIGGTIFAFITSFDDVVMALFLTSIKNRTLPKLMYEGLAHDFDPTVISASCLLIIATALILLANMLFKRIAK